MCLKRKVEQFSVLIWFLQLGYRFLKPRVSSKTFQRRSFVDLVHKALFLWA